jgi:hypothetical protein
MRCETSLRYRFTGISGSNLSPPPECDFTAAVGQGLSHVKPSGLAAALQCDVRPESVSGRRKDSMGAVVSDGARVIRSVFDPPPVESPDTAKITDH